jgi:predicted NAD-dependent protein-ADP-ribosyltransferase YbiA (DUF1768 family)
MSTDKLYFYSKSKDAAPGKGAREFVMDPTQYNDLKNTKDWRKILSNFHNFPFKFGDGNGDVEYTYNTIEHVFQAKKIEIVDKDKAFLFTLESGHEIGLGDGELARKNRKLCKLNSDQLRQWSEIKDQIMHNAAMQKYKVCEDAQKVLLATKSAELWHIMPRSNQPVRFDHLEKIRYELQNK